MTYACLFLRRKSNNIVKYKEEVKTTGTQNDIFPPCGRGVFQTSLSFTLYIRKYAYDLKYMK